MNLKKQAKRKLITLQNTYGKKKGMVAWLEWKKDKDDAKAS